MAWHYIRTNKAAYLPQHCVFLDTETHPTSFGVPHTETNHTLRLGCAIYNRRRGNRWRDREVCEFTDIRLFWAMMERICKRRHCVWIFAHSVGFDAEQVGLREAIDVGMVRVKRVKSGATNDSGYDPAMIVTDDPPTIIKLEFVGGGTMVWVDTLNWWREPLESIGQSVALHKLPMPDFSASDAEWSRYCLRDACIIETAVKQLMELVQSADLGRWRMTAPSQAFAAWRHRFAPRLDEKRTTVCVHDEKPVRKIERKSYFGGHIQCFYLGPIGAAPQSKELRKYSEQASPLFRPSPPVYELDVTALYPSVMRGREWPCKLKDWHIATGSDYTPPVDFEDVACAEVFINTLERPYPKRTKNGVIYPVGEYWTTLCGDELFTALRSNHIELMRSWSTYHTDDLFTSFVDWFWERRIEAENAGNVIDATLFKLLMNSLYGKFGQRGARWVFDDRLPIGPQWEEYHCYNPDGPGFVNCRCIGDRVQRQVIGPDSADAMPIISACITSAARERMRALRAIAGPQAVYYQATDSLHVGNRGLMNLANAGEVAESTLGKLHRDGQGEFAHYFGPNDYVLGDKECRPGIPPKAKPAPGGAWYVDCFEGVDDLWSHPPTGGVIVARRRRSLRRLFEKGIVDESGWVQPYLREDRRDKPDAV